MSVAASPAMARPSRSRAASVPARAATLHEVMTAPVQDLLARNAALLMRGFWVLAAGLAALAIASWRTDDFVAGMLALGVGVLALLPSWMWLRSGARGIPFVPIIAVFEFITTTLPVLSRHEGHAAFLPGEIHRAVLSVGLYLAAMCVLYGWSLRLPMRQPRAIRALPVRRWNEDTAGTLCLSVLGLVVLWHMLLLDGILWQILNMLPQGAFSIARSIVDLLGISATFLVGLLAGLGALRGARLGAALALVAVFAASVASGLILAGAAPILFAYILGRLAGSGRMPWLALAVSFAVLTVLNEGKWEMRGAYWNRGPASVLSGPRDLPSTAPRDLPRYYFKWFGHGIDQFAGVQADPMADAALYEEDNPFFSVFNRASGIQMVAEAQSIVPAFRPHLHGETYWITGPLLIPRVFWPDKPRTHMGQVIMNVHLGRQSEEDTFQTYISWGAVAEAWVNFGWLGVALIGAAVGAAFGWAGRWCAMGSVASLRSLVAVILVQRALAFSALSFSIFATSTFQALVVAVALGVILMRGTKGLRHR